MIEFAVGVIVGILIGVLTQGINVRLTGEQESLRERLPFKGKASFVEPVSFNEKFKKAKSVDDVLG